jgi:protein SCO1
MKFSNRAGCTALSLRRGWVAALLPVALLAAAGCESARGERTDDGAPAVVAAMAEQAGPASEHAHHVHAAPVEMGEPTDYSIYHLESAWWDQHGEERPLATLGGRVQVVSMVYTHCSYTCPRILGEMKRLEGELEDVGGVGFVLVSIDPERDTPDRLRSFAESTRLDAARWTLLSGSDDALLELATLLGIKFRRESEQDFSHSNVLIVLDPAGEIVFRQTGLGEDHGPMLEAIRAALPSGEALGG